MENSNILEKNKLKSKNFKKGYSIDLNIHPDDSDLLQASKNFIENLDKEYKIFIENIKYNKKKWNTYLKKLEKLNKTESNSLFYPEVLTRLSPITIINAPWGSGKTFFIEEFCKHLALEKISSDYFKKTIIIDSWKHSSSKNIPDEVMSEIFYKLINKVELKKKNF